MGYLGPGAHKVLFEPSKIFGGLYWGLSFALGCGVFLLLLLLGSNIFLSMVVQQQYAVLEFSREQMSECPSTSPSCVYPGNVL